MLAAVAITAAHAGNPKTLRGTNSVDDCPETCPDKYKPVTDDKGVEYPNKCYLKMAQCRGVDSDSGSDDTLVDLTDIFGSGSDESGSGHVLLDLKDLIGSGSDQITLQELIDAIDGDDSGSDGSDDLDIDLSDLFGSDSDSDGSDDDFLDDVQSLFGSGSYDDKLNLKDLIGSGSGQITLQELIDAIEGSDSDDGSDVADQTLVKGTKDKATKGKYAKVIDYDSTSDSDDGSLFDDSHEDDDILVKGGKKTPVETATKSSKSSKASKSSKTPTEEASSVGSLYEDSSLGFIGSDSLDDDDDEILVKGGKKTPVETATKSSKSSKASKSSKTPTEEASSVGSLYEDSSLGFIGSDSQDDETLLKKFLGEDSDSDSASDEDDDQLQQQQQDDDEVPVSEKASKSSKTLA
ncbi:hypothetical protein PHYBOEH_008829 [Phytophthora boehmeriae]|uniref:Kazal-like domain-containing protein n=1 Tax=Phytophthora boehmeriae TaxID=109152 RepID=A0A8T1WZW3_9STRA|nr:hypothetical protein PHYBOEH_008829 [Phytophthora boehmeriae]